MGCRRAKMPSKIVKEERLIKKVTNAINNPTATLQVLKNALDDIKYARCPIYDEDIDLWISKAIALQRYDMILEIFGKDIHYHQLESQVLKLFMFKKQRYLNMFVESDAFHPNLITHVTLLIKNMDKDISYFKRFFALKKTDYLLTSIRHAFRPSVYNQLMKSNPDLQKKAAARKILARFWLLTVKKILPRWKESLYYPGSGALYKKAYRHFKHDLPCLLTCI
jgi:hypothetical protein